MAQRFHPRSFCRADVLRKIDPPHLIQLLSLHRDYLEARGFPFTTGPAAVPDYQQLALILLDAGKDSPLDLIEALHVVGSVGTDELVDDLLDLAIAEGVDLGGDEITPVDLAVRIWLKAPGALIRMERQAIFHKWLTFEHFPARVLGSAVPVDKLPTDLTSLETALDCWFRKNQRGAGVTIQRADSSTEARFLINHGQPCKRVRNRSGTKSRWLHFRPEQTDLVIYDGYRNELRVRAKTPGEVRMYVAEFGRHLFGDSDFFMFTQKYTLKPLQERGREALNCRRIEGLESVRLQEIECVWPAPSNTVETYRGPDVFDHLRIHGLTIPNQPTVHKASFEVKLTGVDSPRPLSIRLPNIATFGRGEEVLLVEQWLRQQGFILPRIEGHHEETNEIMASA